MSESEKGRFIVDIKTRAQNDDRKPSAAPRILYTIHTLTDKDKWNEFSTLLYCLVQFIRFAVVALLE